MKAAELDKSVVTSGLFIQSLNGLLRYPLQAKLPCCGGSLPGAVVNFSYGRGGHYAFSEKARIEMEVDGLTDLDVAESTCQLQKNVSGKRGKARRGWAER